MREEHWLFMLGIGGAMLALCLISLFSRPGSRGERTLGRLLFSCLLLLASGTLGGPGLNSVNLLAVTGLGLPGYALAAALRWL